MSLTYHDTESVKKEVDAAAQSEHLNDDGEVKARHKDEITNTLPQSTSFHSRSLKIIASKKTATVTGGVNANHQLEAALGPSGILFTRYSTR